MSAGRGFPGSASIAPTCGQADMKGVRSQPRFRGHSIGFSDRLHVLNSMNTICVG